ncbi:MAG: PEP-CTERM sorting domain-containing protein [Sedimentisphaerales bacterium]|nr:PEP-CTERM sorting domain-containing protein [Sedimentisphaerales bacterium]
MKKRIWFLLIFFLTSLAVTASADVVAYWRFDDVGDADIEQWGTVAAGNRLPDSDGQTVWRKAVHDYSGNGNHLTTWEYDDTWGGGLGWAGYNWASDVPSGIVPLTGASNALSIQNAGGWPAAMSWSEQSLPSGTNIETMTPAAFTIEASFKAETLNSYHTIVGRDDRYVANTNGDLAAVYFQVMPSKEVAFKFADMDGYWHEIISSPDAVTTGQWYNMVGVSDGSIMSLYLDNVLIGEVDLTASGSTNTALALGNASGGDWESGTWSIGRGLYAGGHGDRWLGMIDEVRISDSALAPSEFLFVPEPATMAILGLGSLLALRKRRTS